MMNVELCEKEKGRVHIHNSLNIFAPYAWIKHQVQTECITNKEKIIKNPLEDK